MPTYAHIRTDYENSVRSSELERKRKAAHPVNLLQQKGLVDDQLRIADIMDHGAELVPK
jgi:hypothetical protein